MRRHLVIAGAVRGAILAVAALIFAIGSTAAMAGGAALVIGNANYTHASAVENALNDARRVGAALQASGFEVETVENASGEQMRQALADFRRRLRSQDAALFYYAGHGAQLGTATQLLPVDSEPGSANPGTTAVMSAERVLATMATGRTGPNVVLIDACRTDAHGHRNRMPSTIPDARMPPRSLLALATGVGSEAYESTSGHGLFTHLLLQAVHRPQSTAAMLRGVRRAVIRASNGAQRPIVASSFGDEVSLADRRRLTAALAPPQSEARIDQARPSRGIQRKPDEQDDAAFWERIKNSRNPNDFAAYLQTFPNGKHAAAARSRAEQLQRPRREAPPLAPSIEPVDGPFYASGDAVVRAGPGKGSARIGAVATGQALAITGRVRGGDWYRLEYKPGATGFVTASVVARGAAPPALTAARTAAAPLASGIAARDAVRPSAPTAEDLIGEVHEYYTWKPQESMLNVARADDLSLAAVAIANPEQPIWNPPPNSRFLLPTMHILPSGPRRGIVINVAEFRLYFFGAEDGVVSLPIGTGRDECRTRLGSTRITRKTEQPRPGPATRSEPQDLSRWPEESAFEGEPRASEPTLHLAWPGVTITGTEAPLAIGSRHADGCIVTYPESMDWLFQVVRPGTAVTVVDQPVKLGWRGGELFMQVHPSVATIDRLRDGAAVPAEEQPIALAAQSDTILRAASGAADRLDWPEIERALAQRQGYPVRITKLAAQLAAPQ